MRKLVLLFIFICASTVAAQEQNVRIANGSDTATSRTTDAVVSGDTAGTISAKLRQLNKIITASWDAGTRINTNAISSVATATTAAWTSATGVNTAVSLTVTGYSTTTIGFNPSGSITAGTLNFEASDDGGTTWYSIVAYRAEGTGGETTFGMNAATKKAWQVQTSGFTTLRVRLNPVITGAGTANIRIQASNAVFYPAALIAVGNGAAGTDTQRVTIASDNSPVPITLPADPVGANADAASLTGSISAKLRQIATNGIPDAPGARQTWIIQSTFQALAANKLFFDLFNASGSGKIIRVMQVSVQKNMSAQTGVAIQFDLNLTTSVGTGGTTLTPISMDSTNTALPAQITARHAASGGAALGSLIMSRFYHSEETNVAAQVQEAFSLWPVASPYSVFGQTIILREGQGLTLKQITSSTAGVYNAIVMFSVE